METKCSYKLVFTTESGKDYSVTIPNCYENSIRGDVIAAMDMIISGNALEDAGKLTGRKAAYKIITTSSPINIS